MAVWVGGGLVLVGAVIPAVFNTFGGQDSGGFFLTRAFEGFHRLMIGSLVVSRGGIGVSPVERGPGDGDGLGELIVLAGMALIAGVIILCYIPAAALQAQAFATKGDGEERGLRSILSCTEAGSRIYMVILAWGSS